MKFPNIIETEHFRFVNFSILSLGDIKKIWEARNHPGISKFMVNTDFIPWDSHLSYVKSLISRKDRIHYGVYFLEDGSMIGSQCVNPINEDGTGESGLYLFIDVQGKGYGKLMKSEFIKYVFENDLLHTITEKVKFDNYRNQQLNLSLGFTKVGDENGYVYFELKKI